MSAQPTNLRKIGPVGPSYKFPTFKNGINNESILQSGPPLPTRAPTGVQIPGPFKKNTPYPLLPIPKTPIKNQTKQKVQTGSKPLENVAKSSGNGHLFNKKGFLITQI